MSDLLTFIVSSFVEHPDEVRVSEMISEDGQHVTLRLSVHPEDMGTVIGKNGNIARALRNLVKARALQTHQRVYIDILEVGAAVGEE